MATSANNVNTVASAYILPGDSSMMAVIVVSPGNCFSSIKGKSQPSKCLTEPLGEEGRMDHFVSLSSHSLVLSSGNKATKGGVKRPLVCFLF